MLTEKTIKLLEEQKELKYTFEGINIEHLIDEILPEIGNLDSHIRDDLIYPNLFHLFYDDHLSNEALENYTRLLISEDYLLFDMDNLVDYSVLKRTFSLLQLVVMVYLYNKRSIFSKELLLDIYDKLIYYSENEKILTGYDEKVGWVDSVPHSADVFAQLIDSKDLNIDQLENIFNVLKDKFLITHFHYTSNEDERVVNVLEKGLKREEITQEFLFNWVDNCVNYEKKNKYPDAIYIKRNVKHLLRSLYFRILDDINYKDLVNHIKNNLDILMKK